MLYRIHVLIEPFHLVSPHAPWMTGLSSIRTVSSSCRRCGRRPCAVMRRILHRLVVIASPCCYDRLRLV